MIARVKKKAVKAGVEIDLQVAICEALPFPTGSFEDADCRRSRDESMSRQGSTAGPHTVTPLFRPTPRNGWTVESQTEALYTSQTSPVANIDRDRIEELPIPSRNFLNFVLLAPAIAAANPALARQTPGAESGGFIAGGLRPTRQ
jgi:hypothetical protein